MTAVHFAGVRGNEFHPRGSRLPFGAAWVRRPRQDVGLHLVVAGRIGNWGRAVASTLVGRLLQLSAAGVVIDGARSQGEILGGVMAFAQPAGRGIYVIDKLAAPVQIAAAGR